MKAKAPAPRTLDDLRAEAHGLLAASGLRPDRAARLAGLLLWFDAAGLSGLGIAALPDLLDRIARGEVNPKVDPLIRPEKAASAVIDGRGAPPLLSLARAAEVASEKAREYGSCLVRIKGIGPVGSALSVLAEVAIGPAFASAFGPGGAWSVALPSPEGPPLLADSALGSDAKAVASPWSSLVGASDWIVQVASVPAMEPLSSFHERVAEFAGAAPGAFLAPDRLEATRREALENGVALASATRSALTTWREKLAV